MSTTATDRRVQERPERRLHTIGAVCQRLRGEFPDISISKIRYLEDQGLLTPKRTRGGYRLFSEEDVERLETILRLQRDEFLPLRVIRQELASGASGERKRRRPSALGDHEGELDLPELCERAGVTPEFVRALEEFGLLVSRIDAGDRLYRETDADVAAACGRLAHYGIDARHLRTFRNSAGREAALLEQLVAPALRSRNPERRKAGLDDLQALAEAAQELSQLLFWRELRALAER
ncbi:MAG TPA: MerR family transcriptional regulator [Gaiellaceae bacterium]|nr:MerR family transcriptional regulator [Gaiellaceae bacterium]